MARKLKSDKILFFMIVLLVGMSIVMVYSASAVMAMDRYEQPYLFLFKQGTWSVLGLFLLGMMMRIDYRSYKQPVVIWSAVIIAIVTLIAVLFSPPINGTRRWFAVMGIGLQPSEFAKLVTILFTAALLERKMDRINDLSVAVLPIGIVVGTFVWLILLEPDFGTALTLVLITAAIVYAAGISYRYLVGAALIVLPLVYWLAMRVEYRRRRVLAFLDPWDDPLGDGFQIIQSLIAVGSGGIFGRGLMAGVQKLFYLPAAHTDFIYAVIAEELGLIGTTTVLMCFGVIAWRGFRISLKAPDRFGTFLALGITTMVVMQAFVNISVVLGLLPTKGLPLPFVSAGGSSLLVNMLGMGILLNVSQNCTRST